MEHTPIIPPQQTYQLLVTATSAFGPPPDRCAWLHGFCLLTLRPGATPVLAQAQVATGERYGDDAPLIDTLTGLLDLGATPVGLDLTGMLSRLGRLPIDAKDQTPALALLQRLNVLISAQPPIDLALSAEGRSLVARHATEQRLGIAERFASGTASAFFEPIDSGNPAALQLALAETADACALALAEMKWSYGQMAALLTERMKWREKLLGRLPRTGA